MLSQDEREQLQMELEEIDVELDSILQREVQLTELLRRMEIQEAEVGDVLAGSKVCKLREGGPD